MDVAYISTLSALGGSVIGGLITGLSSWGGVRLQAKLALLGQEKQRREDLYRDFIVHASQVYADSLLHNEPNVSELVNLYGLVSRMRIFSSPGVVACAEQITHGAADNYAMPNKTLQEIREMIRRGGDMDPLKEFAGAARAELEDLGSL